MRLSCTAHNVSMMVYCITATLFAHVSTLVPGVAWCSAYASEFSSLTLICSSSKVSALLARTLRADSRLATRLLILRLSLSESALELGSPLYVMGRPTFFFCGACKQSNQSDHPRFQPYLYPLVSCKAEVL